MNLTIEQALGDQYLMFYHAQWPVDLLIPVCTLQRTVSEVNRMICSNGKNLTAWSAREQDEIARLMRANWIYQRLGVEPIRKPVLTHLENGQHIVDCGDTRIMALNMLLDPGTVGVACTVPVAQADQFRDWTPICSNQDLIDVSGFSAKATVLIRPGHDQAIEWLEIGDNSTVHHLHSVDQRVSMMQNYMDRNPDAVFDVDWARSYIDWNRYTS
jgi:hypothetical protein